MAENLTEKLVKAQSIDFVENFGNSITSLLTMLGVQRKFPMAAGSVIKTYKSKVTLQNGEVAKGEIIPLSKVEMEEAEPIELAYSKHRKAVAVEDIQKYGFARAIAMTDEKLVRELQKEVRSNFFAQLGKGTTAVDGEGLQGALAQAWGNVQTKFEDDGAMTIAFVNPMDVSDYLAKANITIQNAFGLNYVENFLGVNIVIITPQVKAKTVYATAAENLCFAYPIVNGGEIAKAGFDFVTDETGIIGITHDINKERLTAETTTLSGGALFAERLDGIIKITIKAAATPTV